jgi:hypothetical protein
LVIDENIAVLTHFIHSFVCLLTDGNALANETADAMPNKNEFFFVKAMILDANGTSSSPPPLVDSAFILSAAMERFFDRSMHKPSYSLHSPF